MAPKSPKATKAAQPAKSEPERSHNKTRRWLNPLHVAVVIFAAVLIVLFRKQLPGGRLQVRSEAKLQPLLNYSTFQDSYPRLAEQSKLENSRRHLLFIGDMIQVARHNLMYLLSEQSYSVVQSPFRSDRNLAEQMDVLSQLDEFDFDTLKKRLAQIDSPVSGLVVAGAQLETGNKVNRFFTRILKGDQHFDIPSYPLDDQPDPQRVTHIDADLRDCSPTIRDQSTCGACYAFSWNSYAEWHFCRQSGQQIDFSEQHIVDCGYLAKLGGCQDGLLPSVRDFSHTFGFHLEADYPYRAKVKTCKRAQGEIKVKTLAFKRVLVDRLEWEQLVAEQPILLEVHLPSDILSYQRGVHPGHNCDSRFAHGMLLVGHGRQDGQPYWLLKNSMGRNWGENGYLRLSRDAQMSKCFRTGFISRFKFQNLTEDQFEQLYDSFTFQPSEQIVARPKPTK